MSKRKILMIPILSSALLLVSCTSEIYSKKPNNTDSLQTNNKIEELKDKYLNKNRDSSDITDKITTIKKDKNDKVDVIKETVNENKKNIDELNDYLFIGDSYFTLLKSTIEKNTSNAYIYEKSGTTPTYWLDKVEDMEDDVEGVVVQLGVNGASYSTNIPDMKKLIDKLHKKYPNKKIYICKVFNVSPLFKKVNTDKFNGHINNFNKEIEKYCNKIDNVEFIDCTEGLVKDGELDVTTDGLHISSEGQSIYYNNILEEINKVGD